MGKLPEATQRQVGLKPKEMVDHYRIIRPLGAGGMAEVYLARDTVLGRKVALKIVHPKSTEKKEAIEHFLFEAKATARFNHPHIVSIYSVGVASDVPYIALEYLEGQTLRERLEQERLSLKESIRIAKAIAQALEAAHEKAILHRDLKPDNVMLARDGRLRVLDFGLSQLLGDPDKARADEPGHKVIKTSSVIPKKIEGTPAYMAPEQWKAEKIGPPADVWALGLILYEMLDARHPYHDVPDMHVLASRVASSDPVPKPASQVHISYDLMELLTQCLSKHPAQRPTAKEVVQELDQLLMTDQQEKLEGMSPFRGLVPFEEEHSSLYFGREAEISSFVERLRHEPLVPIVGPSGAGKSSFVKAGVIPRLREKGPLILLQIRPGRDPFRALATRLMQAWNQPTSSMAGSYGPMGSVQSHQLPGSSAENSGAGVDDLTKQLCENPHELGLWLNRISEQHRAYVVLFVDQLEELCTLITEKDMAARSSADMTDVSAVVGVQARFMQAITSAADDYEQPFRVIVTLREEFLIRSMTSAKVRETLSRIMTLRKPSEKTLIEMLNRTLRTVGYKFEDYYLAQELVKGVADSQSSFSLLQFAGQILWQNRDEQRRVLTWDAYDDMGGVTGALVQHADGVLKGLSKEEAIVAKKLFLRLVTEDKTRRIISRTDLLAGLGESAERVLKRLIESRLLNISRKKEDQDEEGDCEIVHEALITQWGHLNSWIEESREELALLNQLRQAAQLWEKRGRRADDLWSKLALQETEAVIEQARDQGSLYSDFVLASKHQIRKRYLWLTSLTVCMLMVLLAAVWAGNNILRSNLCTGAQDKIATVWNRQVKESISKAFLGTGVAYANDTVGRVYDILEAYVKEWADHYTEACQATHARGEQSDEVLDLRMGCMRKSMEELGALVKVFSTADADVVKKAVLASSSLSALALCSDEKSLRAAYPPPKTVEIKTKVAAIRGQLATVKAWFRTGKYREGLALSKTLAREANQVAYLPIQTEVLYLFGSLLNRTGAYHLAEQTLYQAAQAAGDSRDFLLAAKAMTLLVSVVGEKQARHKEGLLLGRDAQVMLSAAGGDKQILLMLRHNVGLLVPRTRRIRQSVGVLSQGVGSKRNKLWSPKPLGGGLPRQSRHRVSKIRQVRRGAWGLFQNACNREPSVGTNPSKSGNNPDQPGVGLSEHG